MAKTEKGQNVENVETKKEERQVVFTTEQIVKAINSNNVTDVQYEAAKQMCVQISMKFATGTIDADDMVILGYVSKQAKRVVNEAEKEAERKDKEAAAEEKYQQELQAHKIEVGKLFETFIAAQQKAVTLAKTKKEILNVSKDILKDTFKTFLETLPAEPKKEGVRGTRSNNSNSEYRDVTLAVKNIKEGSTNWMIRECVQKAGEAGINKEELQKQVFALKAKQGKEMNPSLFSTLLSRALGDNTHQSGQLPELLKKGDLYVWEAIPETSEPELEIVKTTKESK